MRPAPSSGEFPVAEAVSHRNEEISARGNMICVTSGTCHSGAVAAAFCSRLRKLVCYSPPQRAAFLPETEKQNARGRTLYAPAGEQQSFIQGFMSSQVHVSIVIKSHYNDRMLVVHASMQKKEKRERHK